MIQPKRGSMYADPGLLLPFSPEYSPELRMPPSPYSFQDDLSGDFYHMANLMCNSTISEYDLGGEGDLFKAPAPIIEEPELALDPMTAAMSIISAGDDVIAETIKAAAMESIQEDPLMSDIFYECKKDLLEKSGFGEPISELSDIKIPLFQRKEASIEEEIKLVGEGPMQRSISTGCLNSIDWVNGCTMGPNFLDFEGLAFEAGIRRAFSEGDIQTFDNNNNGNLGNESSIHSPFERLLAINDIKAEERREKLSRYRKKKSKRNFDRKIKYACRKALADSQPRVRGRFARTENCEVSKMP